MEAEFGGLYGADVFWAEVAADSAGRLAAPLPFAMEALEDLFRYESDKEQGFVRWQRKLQFVWWADDAVRCIEAVLADPPDELGDLMREHGITVWVGDGTDERIGDAGEHVDWLRAAAVRMREMFERHLEVRGGRS